MMQVVLIGYRGTGKTTVARLLAERLGWSWVDADRQIEQRAGRTIREIFAEQGEQAFRDLEAAVVAELASRPAVVLALGGGAVLRPQARQALAGSTVVWLRADPATIQARLAADAATAEQRPNLTAAGGLDEIEQLLQQRTPIYRESAHYEVDTQGKTPQQVTEEILRLMKPAPQTDQ